MISFKNANSELNENQEKFLAACPLQERRMHELIFSVGNITFLYHSLAKDYKPTLTDWEEWLSGLPAELANHFKAEGFEACQSVLSFTRYVNEKNDIGLDAFIQKHMLPSEYEEYLQL
jgi:hypothetical protein